MTPMHPDPAAPKRDSGFTGYSTTSPGYSLVCRKGWKLPRFLRVVAKALTTGIAPATAGHAHLLVTTGISTSSTRLTSVLPDLETSGQGCPRESDARSCHCAFRANRAVSEAITENARHWYTESSVPCSRLRRRMGVKKVSGQNQSHSMG